MPVSLRNIVRLGDTSAYEPAPGKIVSIGLMPDGFLFALLDQKKFCYIALEEYRLEQEEDGETALISLMDEWLQQHPLSAIPFEQVHVSYFSPRLVLIPGGLFVAGNEETYYTFCSEKPPDTQLVKDHLNVLSAFGLYAVPDSIIKFLNSNFRNYRLKHSGSNFIESVLAAQRIESWQADIIINIKNSFIELLLFTKQQLQYYKSFYRKNFDDVLYYLFLVMEQSGRDASKQQLLIVGELAMDTPEFEMLSKFFPNPGFVRRNDAFLYSGDFDTIPAHYYYNLLNLVSCG
ncbi:MAG: DUF3822 family protein [Bacteroidales bacterium]|nr:DUF3822 family protein [Bacteroidales bacterium]